MTAKLSKGWAESAVAQSRAETTPGFEELRASGGKPIRRSQSDLRTSAKRGSGKGSRRGAAERALERAFREMYEEAGE